MEKVKENKDVLYHFANFAIVNESLIIKNRRICLTYWLMQARDELRPPCQRGRAGSYFLQAAMAMHERRVTLDPRSEP